MTVEINPPAGTYTVMGTGPYAVAWPYVAAAVEVAVIRAGLRYVLVAGVDFSVLPLASTTTGDVTLSAPAAALHAGGVLYLSRVTPPEQGWVGVLGEREKGLERQLDILTMRQQEQDQVLGRVLRLDTPVAPFVPLPDAVVMFNASLQPVAGPTAAAIAAAQGNAQAAHADRVAADAAAVAAAASAASAAAVVAGADVKKANTQTFTGQNTFANHVHIASDKSLFSGTGDLVETVYSTTGDKFIQRAIAASTVLSQRFNGVELNSFDNALAIIHAVATGAVELYFNGGKKFETQAAGAKVTGALSADTAAGNWLATSLEAAAAALNTKLLTPLTVLDFFNARWVLNLGSDGYIGIFIQGYTIKLQWKFYSLAAAAGSIVTVPWPSPFGNFGLISVPMVFGAASQMIGISSWDRFNVNVQKGNGDTAARTGYVLGLGY